MRSAFDEALDAVDPERATAGATEPLDGARIDVLAIGKAAAGMTSGAVDALGGRAGTVLSISDRTADVPWGHLVGEHPFPGPGSLSAGRAALDLARSSNADRLLVLVSGGGSSIVEVPPPGVAISELADLVRSLMDAGVPIGELNVVRRSLSRIKDGRLLEAAAVPVTTLLISDVVDEPASTIASGPTLAAGISPSDVEAIVDGTGAELTPAMRNWIRRQERRDPPSHAWSLVASGQQAAATMASALDAEPPTSGTQGRAADTARRVLSSAPPGFGVHYGETTVVVTGDGRGGRNTEAALAAALELDGDDGAAFGAFATDGVDGTSDAAGAIVDGGSAGRIRSAGIDPTRALERNDSAGALEASGDLVVTGPTGTNVADLWVTWRRR